MGNSNSVYDASNIGDQSGKTFLVTGANTGLGYASAEHLLRNNAHVILACRDLKKANDARSALEKLDLKGKIDVEELDLADLDAVKASSERILKKYKKLDVLMCNAGIVAFEFEISHVSFEYIRIFEISHIFEGIMFPETQTFTKQGVEIQFGVNHLGHFALTLQLLPLLISTPNSRIVVVSSSMHKYSWGINLDDVCARKNYSRMGCYGDSKLANLLFARELQRRLTNACSASSSSSSKVVSSPTVYTAHPGYTATDLQRSSAAMYANFMAMSKEQGSLSQVS